MAISEAITAELSDVRDPDDAKDRQGGPRSLLAYLEAHVEQLAEARTEMRGVRYEAESLRIEASPAQLLAALVEAECDRLAIELAEQRRPWLARAVRAFFDCRSPRHRPF